MTLNVRKRMYAAMACMLLLTAPAFSAVVTVLPNAPASGTALDLSVHDFERLGNCGGGKSVINGGCFVVTKSDPVATHAYGRFASPPQNHWIDSQDIDKLKWTVASERAFTSMTFLLTDAHDQMDSWFDMSFLNNGDWVSIWTIPSMLENGNQQWLRIDFLAPVTAASFLFSTKFGEDYDGYGISSLSVDLAPIPVPGAAILIVSGLTVLVGFRARHKRRAS